MMTLWSKTPPTYKEWLDAKNHGCWWVKFLLRSARTEKIDGETYYYNEAWYTDMVNLTCSHPDGKLFSGTGKLHASGLLLKDFDPDDKEVTKDFYWQPSAAPLDDIKDKRPEV